MDSVREPQPILLVEDSPEDYEAARRAFKQANVRNALIWIETGGEALDYLFRRGKYADPSVSPRPGVILLDLNMPGTDGHDVLRELKGHDELCQIPIVVLTTSGATADVERCYAAGANTYIKKPVDIHSFVEAVQRLHAYWFEVALIPRER